MAGMGGWVLKVGPFGFALVLLFLGNLYARGMDLKKESRAVLLRLQFVIFLESLMFIGSVYLWSNVNRALADCHQLTAAQAASAATRARVVRTVTLAFLGLVHGSYPIALFFTGKDPHPLGMLSFAALGTFIQLVICLPCINSVHWILRKIASSKLRLRPRRGAVSKVQAQRLKVFLATVYALSVVSYGVFCASQPPVIKRLDVPIQKLSPSLDGLRIVQISDIHMGPTVGNKRVGNIVDIINNMKPDVVVLVGDLVDSTVHNLREAAEPFRKLNAVKGKYFVTGNHEYHTSDVDNWFKFWESAGITVLHNKNVKLSSDQDVQHSICLCGTDDIFSEVVGFGDHGFKLDAAVRGCDPDQPIILLAHQPKAAKIALDSDHDIQLVLSGHTHAGQMFPLTLVAYFLNPFYVGLYKYGSGYVYVSPGTLYWGIPMRIGTQHEITELTLRVSNEDRS